MPATITYALPADLVTQLVHHVPLREVVGDLAGIPYNQMKPDQSVRWLFPKLGKGGDWPALNLGKFVFYRQRGELVMVVGLNVERGLGPDGIAVFESKASAARHLMDAKWMWHRFVRNMKDGSVEAALDHIERAGAEVAFDFRAGSVPVSDEHPLPTPTGDIRYSYSGGELRCIHNPKGPPERQSAVGLDTCKTLAELAARFQSLIDPWLWVDLYVGARFQIVSPSKENDAVWRIDRIWRDVLAPLRPWLGQAA